MSKNRSGWEAVTTGFAIAAVFGFLYLRGGSWIWIFPAVFAGLLPMMDGFRRVIAAGQQRKAQFAQTQRRPEQMEREVLQIARDRGGVVTPSLVALETSLSIAEAEQVLGDLASRGHAGIEVRADGRIEYEFADFMRRLD